LGQKKSTKEHRGLRDSISIWRIGEEGGIGEKRNKGGGEPLKLEQGGKAFKGGGGNLSKIAIKEGISYRKLGPKKERKQEQSRKNS